MNEWFCERSIIEIERGIEGEKEKWKTMWNETVNIVAIEVYSRMGARCTVDYDIDNIY